MKELNARFEFRAASHRSIAHDDGRTITRPCPYLSTVGKSATSSPDYPAPAVSTAFRRYVAIPSAPATRRSANSTELHARYRESAQRSSAPIIIGCARSALGPTSLRESDAGVQNGTPERNAGKLLAAVLAPAPHRPEAAVPLPEARPA